ncbi:MAG: cytochrome C [Phycisphaera sp.]|nr:cytochrome C [Phycisphaera sp.]
MLVGVGVTLWVAFRRAAINDTALAQGKPLPVEGKDDKVLVWPDLVYTEMLCLILGSIILVVWSILLRAPLESPANPLGPPNPSKAPWYFLGLQEMLVYFDPWMAGVILPGMIVSGLIGMPYFDTNPKGNGYYTIKERPFAIFTWLLGFIILWVVLIIFGTFLRGPNWNFFGPYQYWDSHLSVPLTNINLSDYVWVFGLKQPLPDNPFVREMPGIIFVIFWVCVLPVILAKTIMRKMYNQMGMLRFAYMALHLVIMGMMPLKMVLRWVFTLKYFIYLPEFNLNL